MVFLGKLTLVNNHKVNANHSTYQENYLHMISVEYYNWDIVFSKSWNLTKIGTDPVVDYMVIYKMVTTLSPPNIVGHSNFLGPMLNLIMRINVGYIDFQPLLGF
jgi:hypothetical protein